jgi:hypothetical protein
MGLMGRPEEAMGGGIEAVAVFGGWSEVKRWWFEAAVCVMMREKEESCMAEGERMRWGGGK